VRQYEVLNLEAHFDADLKFRQQELDPVTGKLTKGYFPTSVLFIFYFLGKQIMKLVEINNPTRDLTSICRSAKVSKIFPIAREHGLMHKCWM
jgi:hypothetical protein